MDMNKNQPAFQITTNLNHLRNQTSEYAKYDNQVTGVPVVAAANNGYKLLEVDVSLLSDAPALTVAQLVFVPSVVRYLPELVD